MSKRPHSEFAADSPDLDGVQGEAKKSATRISLNADLTKWTASAIPESFPALPPILDPAVEADALTHPGATLETSSYGYDRWEWLGDASLEIIATAFIFQTFPSTSPGRMSQLRELCVRNDTLRPFTLYYGLDKKARLPLDWDKVNEDGTRRWTKKEQAKVLADLFESYVGALIFSDPENGMRRASEWLKGLWAITLKDIIRGEERKQKKFEDEGQQKRIYEQAYPRPQKHAKTDHGYSVGSSAAPSAGSSAALLLPKNLLQAKVGVKGIRIEYRDIQTRPLKDKISRLSLFTVGCYFTGWEYTDHLIGQGSALSKKEAGQKAAAMALENKKLITSLEQKKRDFAAILAKQEAEKVAAAEQEKGGEA